MLRHLYIKNYALIDLLDIDFPQGFSVITGETGAGKSIVLGAIGLLLGNRADSKSIKPGEKKCVIEAHFDISKFNLDAFFTENDIDNDPSDCIIRREVNASGKSRAFINDTPASLQMLRQLGERLVDIHSQHQNLLLQKEDFQLDVVDIIAGDDKERNAYAKAFNDYKKADKELKELREQIASAKQNEDFLRFQFTELDNARLSDGLQEELEQESAALTHSEDIKSGLFHADNLLNGDTNGIVEATGTAAEALHSIEKVYPKVSELASRLDSAKIELEDIASDVSADAADIDFDPTRLDTINAKLDTIYSLEQKHHVKTVEELISIRDDIEKQLEGIDDSDTQTAELEQRVAETEKESRKKAEKLTVLRKKAAAKVEKDMKSRLEALGMPNVRFEVKVDKKELSADGADKVQFLFSANKSMTLRPVSEVASGGEIARVMLSLKAMISGAVNLPTIIFDEIDTGVSGAIASKMAQMMREMAASGRQVISITHLPQIAAMGTAHYKVEKRETESGTTSVMRQLSNEERVTEIASMLSGDNITDAALQNARVLLGED